MAIRLHAGVHAFADDPAWLVVLKKAGLIRYVRRSVTVVDRRGLEFASCDCYAAIWRAYDYSQIQCYQVIFPVNKPHVLFPLDVRIHTSFYKRFHSH